MTTLTRRCNLCLPAIGSVHRSIGPVPRGHALTSLLVVLGHAVGNICARGGASFVRLSRLFEELVGVIAQEVACAVSVG